MRIKNVSDLSKGYKCMMLIKPGNNMSFDGIPKPTQLNPYTGAMNPYVAANAARTEKQNTPLVKSPEKEDKIRPTQRDERQYHQADDEEERGETFSEEEAEQIRIMAKMRGIMNLALEEGKRYEFRINPENNLVDLIEVGSGTLILQLEPEELMTLSRKMQRYAGMLTDRAG